MLFLERFFLTAALRLFCAVGCFVASGACLAVEREKSLFNGSDLSGWMQVGNAWSVKDGAITCQPGDDGSLLVWKGGEVSDFEFTCKFRFVMGLDKKWWFSGVRYRNRITNPERLGMEGPYYELNLNVASIGNFLEGSSRGLFAPCGRRSFIVNSGDILHPFALYSADAFPDLKKVRAAYKQEEWNELKIVAVGRRVIHFLNGTEINEVIDETPAPILSGSIALFKGPIQFKDLTLRDLKGITAVPPVSGLPAEAPPKWTAARIQYLKAGSASRKPKGTKIDRFPKMDTDDPNDVANGKPIYFDIHTGTEVHYDVSADAPLTELSFVGWAYQTFWIEIRDYKGTVLKDCYKANAAGRSVLRIPLPNLTHFEVVFKNDRADWLLIEDLHFGSAPQAVTGRTLAQTSAATPVPRYVAPPVPRATPVPPPPPVVQSVPPPSPTSGSPASPGSPTGSHSRTPSAGGQSGKQFAEMQPEGGVLVGLDIWKGEYYRALVIGGVRGIYRTEKGLVRGEIFGRGNGEPDITMKADRGDSAIAEVEAIDDGQQILALRVRFGNGQQTPWFGRETPRNLPANKMPRNLHTTRLHAGSWKGALGIYGGADGTLFSLGLIY